MDSVADLKRLIQRCNLLLLRFPHDAFGGKGKDLMELFEVLQLQAQGLLQVSSQSTPHICAQLQQGGGQFYLFFYVYYLCSVQFSFFLCFFVSPF